MRHILHIHIPAFAIAVARVCQAELRDRPVAVAPPQSERALILSASSEARAEGVFKGMPLFKARRLCPALTLLPPNPGLMERASRALSGLVSGYTPLWEPSRPGHIYLDLTGTERLWGRVRDTGFRLRREIKDRLDLSGTVGVAGNKMVSSIASRVTRAEGIVDVERGGEALFMAPLKVGVVPGIGRIRQKILLEELNIVRVRELALLEMGELRLVFGREAFVMHQRALGIDPRPVFPAPRKPVVSQEITFPEDENNDERLLSALYALVEKCAYGLRQRGLCPRRADLLIRYSDQAEARQQVTLPRISFWDADLYGPLEGLFFRACRRRVRVRFMRVRYRDFTAPSGQRSLFHTPSPGGERGPLLTQALDRIRARHGEAAIRYGRAA